MPRRGSPNGSPSSSVLGAHSRRCDPPKVSRSHQHSFGAPDRRTLTLRFVVAAPVAALSAALALCGCGSSSPAGPPVPPLHANLSGVPDGTAQLQLSGAAPTLSLDAFGLPNLAPIEAAIRIGSCLSRSSVTIAKFGNNATPDSSGRINATLRAPGSLTKLPAGQAFVALSNAANGADMACTDLDPTNPTLPVRIYPVPGARPAGSATVTYTPATRVLQLVLSPTAVEPASSYTAAIREGTCANEGPVTFH
jgi:hypothetical protein